MLGSIIYNNFVKNKKKSSKLKNMFFKSLHIA